MAIGKKNKKTEPHAPVLSVLQLSAAAPAASATAVCTPSAATVAPVVVVAILDHALRRKDGQSRVIGALLGSHTTDVDGRSVVNASNSFPVLYSETNDGKIVVDMDYFSRILALHNRVNPKETLVGFYICDQDGIALDANAVWVYETILGETLPWMPVVVWVDPVEMKNGVKNNKTGDALAFPVRAFVGLRAGASSSQSVSANENQDENPEASSPIFSDSSYGTLFLEVPASTSVSGSDRVALDTIARPTAINGITSMPTTASDVMDMPVTSDLDALDTSVRMTHKTLASALEYVDKILSSENASSVSAKDTTIGRYLHDIVSTSPAIDVDEFQRALSGHVQDTVMVLWLSKLTRTQIAIAERLYRMG